MYETHSLSEFRENAEGYLVELNESKIPISLTVDGRVQAILLDPSTFREIEERLEQERFEAAILEGEADIAAGRVRSVEDVFAELRLKHGF